MWHTYFLSHSAVFHVQLRSRFKLFHKMVLDYKLKRPKRQEHSKQIRPQIIHFITKSANVILCCLSSLLGATVISSWYFQVRFWIYILKTIRSDFLCLTSLCPQRNLFPPDHIMFPLRLYHFPHLSIANTSRGLSHSLFINVPNMVPTPPPSTHF